MVDIVYETNQAAALVTRVFIADSPFRDDGDRADDTCARRFYLLRLIISREQMEGFIRGIFFYTRKDALHYKRRYAFSFHLHYTLSHNSTGRVWTLHRNKSSEILDSKFRRVIAYIIVVYTRESCRTTVRLGVASIHFSRKIEKPRGHRTFLAETIRRYGCARETALFEAFRESFT